LKKVAPVDRQGVTHRELHDGELGFNPVDASDEVGLCHGPPFHHVLVTSGYCQ
jgi:hypothetical protein